MSADTLNVTVLNGSPNSPSKSLTLTGLATDEFARNAAIEVSTVSVYQLGAGFTGALWRDDVDDLTEAALRSVETADVLVVTTPVFKGSYPGLFDHFVDLLDQYALVKKPVSLLATGGSERHGLVIDQALRPLFAFFSASVTPTGVFATSAAFDGELVLDAGVHTRIQLAVDDALELTSLRHQRLSATA